jgi:hypothetical protein
MVFSSNFPNLSYYVALPSLEVSPMWEVLVTVAMNLLSFALKIKIKLVILLGEKERVYAMRYA